MFLFCLVIILGMSDFITPGTHYGSSLLVSVNNVYSFNSASYSGGAIHVNFGYNHSFTGDIFFNNSVLSYHGGALFVESTTYCFLKDCLLNNNQAKFGYGGGLYISDTLVSLENSNFTLNLGSLGGGGLYWKQSNFVPSLAPLITGCLFLKNIATYGQDFASIGTGLVLSAPGMKLPCLCDLSN